jgi:hypothetical protein
MQMKVSKIGKKVYPNFEKRKQRDVLKIEAKRQQCLVAHAELKAKRCASRTGAQREQHLAADFERHAKRCIRDQVLKEECCATNHVRAAKRIRSIMFYLHLITWDL